MQGETVCARPGKGDQVSQSSAGLSLGGGAPGPGSSGLSWAPGRGSGRWELGAAGNRHLAEIMSTVHGVTMSSDITVIGGCWCRVGWPGWHTAAPHPASHLPASSTL